MSFSSQGFAPEVVKALAECGYEKLTPIQQKAIPMARKGHDILQRHKRVRVKLPRSLPIIQQLLESGRSASRKTARALIMAPTRELAEQIADNIKAYTKYTELSVAAILVAVRCLLK